jgi:hypothetical protein
MESIPAPHQELIGARAGKPIGANDPFVLRSLDAANWARIERVVIEYHDIGRNRNHVELMEILRTNSFEVEAIHASGRTLSALLGVRVGMIWAKKLAPRFHQAAHI